MPQKKLRQYILYNVGIWFATAFAAILLLVAVRQYGTAVTARGEAESLLAEARSLLQADAAFECQRAIAEAVRIYPPIAEQVAEEFRGSLLALPVIHDQIRQVIDGAPDRFSLRSRALLTVLESPPPQAAQALEATAGEAQAPELLLWRARLALEQGDVPAAAAAFSRYWQTSPERRQQLRRDLTGPKEPDPALYASITRRLFHAGMWTETFGMVEQARKRGVERPSFGYYDGVKLEMLQKPEEAKAAYEKVLATTPNYRPAQLALARLKAEG